MATVITAWDTTAFQAEVLEAFYQVGVIPDAAYLRSASNDTNITWGNMAAITVKNFADNQEMTDNGVTEAGTTISPDSPLKGWVYIPQSMIDTHNTPVLQSYSKALGGRIRAQFERRLQMLLAKNYKTQVTFNNDADCTGDQVAAALATISENFDIAEIPAEGRYVLLHPTYFTKLYNVAGVRSGDFITGADNSRPFNMLNFLGMNVRSYVGNFGTNKSADTNFDSKYRVNLASYGSPAGPVLGVAWHREAIGVNMYSDITITSDRIPEKDAYFTKGRMLIGTGITRTDSSCIQALIGD